MIPFEKILVPTDFGPSSERAVATAMELAKQYGAELTLLHVWDVPPYAYSGMALAADELLRPLRDRADARLAEALRAVKDRLPGARGLLRCGEAWNEIDQTIRETAPDLVVMGTRGTQGVVRFLVGSVAEKVVRTSLVPVLTVHAKIAEPVRSEDVVAGTLLAT